MIVWSGWGILTILITALVGGGVGVLGTAALAGMGMVRAQGLAVVLGLLAAAAVNWVVGRRLNGQPGREMIDKTTGQTVVLRRSHRLFFIKMEWWSVLLAGMALVALWSTLFGAEITARRPGADPTPGATTRPL